MKRLSIKQIMANKRTNHLKTKRYILGVCILLFAATGITGCTKEYTADDIKAYAEDRLSLKQVSVNKTSKEIKGKMAIPIFYGPYRIRKMRLHSMSWMITTGEWNL